jgi:hypothetical protein
MYVLVRLAMYAERDWIQRIGVQRLDEADCEGTFIKTHSSTNLEKPLTSASRLLGRAR